MMFLVADRIASRSDVVKFEDNNKVLIDYLL